MAGVLEAQGRLDAALPFWRQALACEPTSAGHRFNLALALMRCGALREGLALQEARYEKPTWSSLAAAGSLDGLQHRIPRPGDDLAGRRVLVFTEQGLGDCIWAARWLPRLEATGARLTLAARPALRPVLEQQARFEAVLEPPADTPGAKINLAAFAGRFDALLPIMSLPWLPGVTAADGAHIPWLRPDPRRVADWRRRYREALPNARIHAGLVWQVNPESVSANARSLPIEAFAGLAARPGLGLVALQGGTSPTRARLHDVLPDAIDGLAGGEPPLVDLAAAIAATDVLITVDTMAMHLAGAMGHPAFVLASHEAPGFVLGREGNCAWYPSLRLQRRLPEEDWAAVVQRIAFA
jgi:ADP-heptose:LPS heptosyltransferase